MPRLFTLTVSERCLMFRARYRTATVRESVPARNCERMGTDFQQNGRRASGLPFATASCAASMARRTTVMSRA